MHGKVTENITLVGFRIYQKDYKYVNIITWKKENKGIWDRWNLVWIDFSRVLS